MRLSRKWWFGAVPTWILGTALLAGPADATLSTAKSTVLAQSVVKPTTIFSHGTTATGQS